MTGVVHARARGDDVPIMMKGLIWTRQKNDICRARRSLRLKVSSLALDNWLISLPLTDNRGFEADTLDPTLDDTDGQVALLHHAAQRCRWRWAGIMIHWFWGVWLRLTRSDTLGPPGPANVGARSADLSRYL